MSNSIKIKKIKGIAPFDNDSLPQFALKKCEEELNETPENKENGLRELTKWIQADVKIGRINFHADFLVQYLRRHKYNIKGAVKQIQNYVVFRKSNRNLFQKVSDEYFLKDETRNILNILPFRCPDGCSVIIMRVGKIDSGKMPLEDLKRIITLTFLQLLRDPMAQINGIKMIYDFKGTSLRHLRYATFDNIYLYYNLAINCMPGRYKEMHFVNESMVMKITWMFVKRIFPEKIVRRVHTHSDEKELLNHFPRYMLPTEYGGELTENDLGNWIRIANEDFQNYPTGGKPNFY